jgi:hypothetical protein
MSARKQQHIAMDSAQAAHNAIRPGGYLLRRFTSRATVAEKLPFWTLCADLGPAAAFVFAIVPLDQVTIDFGNGAESGQLTSPNGAL